MKKTFWTLSWNEAERLSRVQEKRNTKQLDVVQKGVQKQPKLFQGNIFQTISWQRRTHSSRCLDQLVRKAAIWSNTSFVSAADVNRRMRAYLKMCLRSFWRHSLTDFCCLFVYVSIKDWIVSCPIHSSRVKCWTCSSCGAEAEWRIKCKP